MNIKPLSKLFLYATVAMLMSVSCKKKDPSDYSDEIEQPSAI